MKRVVLFGAPGAGKGTQAEVIRDRYGFIKISTGDLIRNEVTLGSAIGNQVKSTIEQGKLVSDEVIIEVVKNRLAKGDIGEGYILDGFPRTIAQAKAMEKIPADKDFVFYLKVGDPSRIIGRVVTRLTCAHCGATFSTMTKLPSQEGICDFCHGGLHKRSDDMEATIRQRIQIYRRETKPVIDYFRRLGVLIEIDASLDIANVTATIGGYLQ